MVLAIQEELEPRLVTIHTRVQQGSRNDMQDDTSSNWRELLRQKITEKGLRLTQQRMLISEVFFEEVRDHANIDELYQKVRKRHSGIGYATVYRTLKLLTDCGLATSMQSMDGTRRFEPTSDHHDHLTCTECEKSLNLRTRKLSAPGRGRCKIRLFLTSHTMDLYGVCTGMKLEGVCSVQKRVP